jgi:hypothetical protein
MLGAGLVADLLELDAATAANAAQNAAENNYLHLNNIEDYNSCVIKRGVEECQGKLSKLNEIKNINLENQCGGNPGSPVCQIALRDADAFLKDPTFDIPTSLDPISLGYVESTQAAYDKYSQDQKPALEFEWRVSEAASSFVDNLVSGGGASESGNWADYLIGAGKTVLSSAWHSTGGAAAADFSGGAPLGSTQQLPGSNLEQIDWYYSEDPFALTSLEQVRGGQIVFAGSVLAPGFKPGLTAAARLSAPTRNFAAAWEFSRVLNSAELLAPGTSEILNLWSMPITAETRSAALYGNGWYRTTGEGAYSFYAGADLNPTLTTTSVMGGNGKGLLWSSSEGAGHLGLTGWPSYADMSWMGRVDGAVASVVYGNAPLTTVSAGAAVDYAWLSGQTLGGLGASQTLFPLGATAAKGGMNFDGANLQSKLEGYLLNAAHPQNQTKAVWFEQALGFNQSNWQQLASQITVNESKAVATKVTQFGQTFEQSIPISGLNGKTINVTFVFMKDNAGTVRLVTGIPAK